MKFTYELIVPAAPVISEDKFYGRYRIESTRLKGYDYASPGWYFITICIKNNRHMLGKIRDGVVILSKAGEIVAEEWQRTAEVRPYVELDAWVVMPNHFHALVGITSASPAAQAPEPSKNWKAHSLGAIVGQFKSMCTKRIRRAGVKDFAWLPRYYDRIVWDQRAFFAIRRYIELNPRRWSQDARWG